MSTTGKRWTNVTEKNKLSVVRPYLIKYWDYEKNYPITPYDVSFGSAKKFWWKCKKCKKSHLASICNRKTGEECPNYDHRSNQGKNIPKERTIEFKSPNLISYWHPTKNGELTPYNVAYRSHKSIWWKCFLCESEWQKKVYCYKQNLSHICVNKKCLNHRIFNVDHKSLAKFFPELIKEWHPLKNGKLTPYNVSYGSSSRKVWWMCENKHEWMATINNRTNNNNGCPYCDGRIAHKNNCFASLFPELVKEWHATKNYKFTPYNVTKSSSKKIHWICKNKHEWIAPVYDRSHGHGCPHCKKIILKDGNKCDSMVEAYFYLYYKSQKIKFKHNEKYSKLFGKKRYDFYLINQNKYVEVTSFNKRDPKYKFYFKKIIKKKNFVEKVLKAKFEFIHKKLTSKERLYIKNQIRY